MEDFQSLDYLLEHEILLVYSVCYVTAKFLPSGEDIRVALFPKVSEILKDCFISCQKSEFSTLKALIILYTYADLPPSSQNTDPQVQPELPFWPLKALVELHALDLSLHRSVEELQFEIRSGSSNVVETMAFQKYTYWLWLFTMSQ
jgi:hypothetical protein